MKDNGIYIQVKISPNYPLEVSYIIKPSVILGENSLTLNDKTFPRQRIKHSPLLYQ